MKRTFDIVVASFCLVLFMPLVILIAILIKLESRGSIFYRGIRTGLHGRPFKMLKLRTMVENAESLGGPSTGKNDSRVTKVGRFLRHFKLDEIPQLFNVLRGEMSIVGPRPEVPQYTDLYAGEEVLILSMRPGITDYSSIEFSRLDEVLGDENPDQVYEEKVRPIKNALRVKYVKEQSFWSDMRIILRTLWKVAVVDRGVH
jgi:lipopolysaccharide/colanic/teichoic acid biosynthesis glycosyltransferase